MSKTKGRRSPADVHLWAAQRLVKKPGPRDVACTIRTLLHEQERAERDAVIVVAARIRGLLADKGIEVSCAVVCQAVQEVTGQRTSTETLWRDMAVAHKRIQQRRSAAHGLDQFENEFQFSREQRP